MWINKQMLRTIYINKYINRNRYIIYLYININILIFPMYRYIVAICSCEVSSIIRFLCAKREVPVAIHRQILSLYGANSMSLQIVCHWVQDFDEEWKEVYDAPQVGRPSDANVNSITAVPSTIFSQSPCSLFYAMPRKSQNHVFQLCVWFLRSHHILIRYLHYNS